MRKFYYFILLLVLLTACSENKEGLIIKELQNDVVFLIAGQSNAVGMGEDEKSFFEPQKEVYEYNSIKDSLIILKDPVGQNHFYFQQAKKGSFIPALSYTFNQISKKKVISIQAAKGGSSLVRKADKKQWGNWSDKGNLFPSSVCKTETALEIINHKNINAIFWSQGETDGEALSKNLITEAEYKKSLVGLIKRYQDYFGKKVPFIIIETGRIAGDESKDEGYKKVRETQREVAHEMDNVYIGYNETEFFIERDWLIDVVHYNQEALNDIGKKLAYFYASLIE